LVEENQKKSVPFVYGSKSTPALFGNTTGQRIEVTWQHDKMKVHGWRSFCKSGNDYYNVCQAGVWKASKRRQPCHSIFKLEKSFSLTEKRTIPLGHR